jgi:hypothetical protein
MDEDMIQKAMRRKAVKNLNCGGTKKSSSSFINIQMLEFLPTWVVQEFLWGGILMIFRFRLMS